MDEVDILLTELQSNAPTLIPILFNNTEHRIGGDKFIFRERGVALYHEDAFYDRILLLTIYDGCLSISIARNVDGVIFYDFSEQVDLYAPDFMIKAVKLIKFCQTQLLSFYITDQKFNDRMNSIVKNR